MDENDRWEAAEPGVRRRILQARGRLMLMEVEFIAVPANALHGAKALESGTLIDVFTPVREDLLAGR